MTAPLWSDAQRLWSLGEMLKVSARNYLSLGGRLEMAVNVFVDSEDMTHGPWGRRLNDDEKDQLKGLMEDILEECRGLGLPISTELIANRLDFLPQTSGELNVLIEAINAEFNSQLFLFVPVHRAKYHQLIIQSTIQVAFPSATAEIAEAANSYTFGLNTACVFHSMRAAEIGLRALAHRLGVTFSFDLALAEWHNLLDQIDKKINEMKNLPRSLEKDADLQFYSQAASQFRYFKDGWRTRVSHARAVYNEQQARDILEHTISFFQTLSVRLSEVP